MSNVSVPNGRGVSMPREIVQERVADVLRRYPDLISFDPTEDKYEALVLRCKTDPGPGHAQRDGWTGLVCDWYFGTFSFIDEKSGELITRPSLCLITTDGGLVRLTNSESALNMWVALLREIGVERVKQGLMVRVSLRPSQTAGRHYWQILPA